jgi:hypothetical protein
MDTHPTLLIDKAHRLLREARRQLHIADPVGIEGIERNLDRAINAAIEAAMLARHALSKATV